MNRNDIKRYCKNENRKNNCSENPNKSNERSMSRYHVKHTMQSLLKGKGYEE